MALSVSVKVTLFDEFPLCSLTDLASSIFRLSYVPIVFLSAKTGSRLHLLMPEIIKVYNNSRQEIKTSVLNNIFRDAYDLNPAPSYKGRKLKIYYVTEVGVAPIRLNLYVNVYLILIFHLHLLSII